MRIDPEFQALIPPLSDDEYAALELSIIAEGCRDAIVVWQHDGDDIIVDGHNRYAICTAAGLPYNTVTRDFSSRSDVMLWMIRNQLARRNLTPFKRTELALRMRDVIADQAEQNSLANLKQNRTESLNLDNRTPINTGDEIGNVANVSRATAYKVQKVLKEAPAHIVDKARSGDISIHVAHALAGQPDEVVELALRLVDDSGDKVAILARLYKSNGKDGSNATFDEIATNGGFHYGDEMDEWCDFAASSARQIEDALHSLAKYHQVLKMQEREERKEERRVALGARVSALTGHTKKYRIIYADPPWRYREENHSKEGDVQVSVLETHYPTLSIQELCELPVYSICEPDAVLFLWVTSPLLEECFDVIRAWGFKYKTSMVWDKVKHNVGNYVSVRHELLLICTRGACTPDNRKLHDSVQSIERGGHSQKPEAFRAIIDEIYTYGDRIELFRRGDAPDGWDVWGNEANE